MPRPQSPLVSQRKIAPFLRLRWLGGRRVTAYSAILLLCSLASLYWIFRDAMGHDGSDFLAFWSAARMAGDGGAAQVYDPAALRAIQATVGRADVFAFVNPPPMLLIVWPLHWLSYPAAWVAWVLATYLAWFLGTRRLFPELAWPVAAFPGALLAAWHAQTGFLTSFLQAGAARYLRDRPFQAGLWIGALIIKPQLAVLFPVALVAGRQWRAIAGAATSAVALFLLAWLVFGSATMRAYPQAWSVSQYLMATGDDAFFLRQTTVYAMARVAFTPFAATLLQTGATASAVLLTWLTFSRGGTLDGKLALLFAATPLATPYLFSYDLPFLIIPIGWLVRTLRPHDLGGWSRPVLVFLYLAPLLTRAMALPLGINPMPLVSMATVWLIWHRLFAGETADRQIKG